jgi:hypothetical protein
VINAARDILIWSRVKQIQREAREALQGFRFGSYAARQLPNGAWEIVALDSDPLLPPWRVVGYVRGPS